MIIRPSGTEPVVRVMVEGIDAQVKASAERIASSVEKLLQSANVSPPRLRLV